MDRSVIRRGYDRLPETIKGALRNFYYRFPISEAGKYRRWLTREYNEHVRQQRKTMFMSIASFCHINRPLTGYYIEFGSHSARTMRMAWDSFHHLFDWTYVACDSFEGLPAIGEIDRQEIWKKGNLRTDEATFRHICERHGIPSNRLQTVRGFFDNSLTDTLRDRLLPQRAAVVYVDCDLYESAVPVLRFIKELLQPGTVIVFDDWNCFRADPERGERRAFAEFCAASPGLRFEPFYSTDMQKAFVFLGKCVPSAAEMPISANLQTSGSF